MGWIKKTDNIGDDMVGSFKGNVEDVCVCREGEREMCVCVCVSMPFAVSVCMLLWWLGQASGGKKPLWKSGRSTREPRAIRNAQVESSEVGTRILLEFPTGAVDRESAVKQKDRERKGPPETIQKFRLRNWTISSAHSPMTPMEGREHHFGPFLEKDFGGIRRPLFSRPLWFTAE